MLARFRNSMLPSPFHVSLEVFWLLLLHGREKLSEVFKSFPRTFPAPSGQLYIVSRFRKAEPSVAKRTKITIETDSLLILRSRSSRRAWCPRCVTEADMIALDEVGVISNLQRQALEEWLNSEELTARGHPMARR